MTCHEMNEGNVYLPYRHCRSMLKVGSGFVHSTVFSLFLVTWTRDSGY